MLNKGKWMAPLPMVEGILAVAQAQGGVSWFLVPRRTPGGELNGVRVNPLKGKLGNLANTASEIECCNVRAILIAEEGRGVRTTLSSAEYAILNF